MAQWLGGTLIEGDKAPERLTGLSTLQAAGPSEIAFLAGKAKREEAESCAAGLLLTPENCGLAGRARIEVPEVWIALATLMRRLYPPSGPKPGVHPTAVVGEGVTLGNGVAIGPLCVLGDGVQVGDGVVLGPHCSIDSGCRIGADSRFYAHVSLQGPVEVGSGVILHSGVVLGADGFRFERVGAKIEKIPQVGRVVIEDDVEIGANTTIDRAFLHETRVGAGTKIDNLVQIGHNVSIGRSCILVAGVMIGGSATIEDDVILAGQAAIGVGVRIGKGSMLGGRSGARKDVPPGSRVSGLPLLPVRDYLKVQAQMVRLPEFARRLRKLEKELSEISGKLSAEETEK